MKRAMRTLGLAALGAAALAAALPATSGAATSARAAQDAAPAAVDPVIAVEPLRARTSRPPRATSPPPSTRPTSSRWCTRRSTTRSSRSTTAAPPLPDRTCTRARGASLDGAPPTRPRTTRSCTSIPSLRALDRPAVRRAARARAAGPRRKATGVRVGRRVAAQLLARRADDGAGASPAPVPAGHERRGDYQLTPPAFAAPVFTHWPQVTPFVLRRANEFRPPPPPALTSPQVRRRDQRGEARSAPRTGSTRTPDQTQIGLFWNAPIWATWNRIAQTAALAHHGDPVPERRARSRRSTSRSPTR